MIVTQDWAANRPRVTRMGPGVPGPEDSGLPLPALPEGLVCPGGLGAHVHNPDSQGLPGARGRRGG